jgi:hypothetical protein
MLVTIYLVYPGDDGPITLDLWNIKAPSVAAVERLVREDMGPALRRHGRQLALKLGMDELEYCSQALVIGVMRAPIYTVSEMMAGLSDQRGTPRLDENTLRRHAARKEPDTPGQLHELLTRHGIAGTGGRRLPYRKPKPKPLPSLFDENGKSDKPPF